MAGLMSFTDLVAFDDGDDNSDDDDGGSDSRRIIKNYCVSHATREKSCVHNVTYVDKFMVRS